jgi:mersacidin/lichenicidin family type 2 lantibiotic
MTNEQIINAWKDEGFLAHLSETERIELPPNPAGLIEIREGVEGEEGDELNLLSFTLTFNCTMDWIACSLFTVCRPSY